MLARSTRSLRGRRRKVAAFACLTSGLGLAIVGFACGFDSEGTKAPPPDPAPDTSPLNEASVIPKTDATEPMDAPIDAPKLACPTGLLGPSMLEVPDAGFCIDSTEVTNADYNAFLAKTDGGALDAGLPEGGLPTACTAAIYTFARNGNADGGAPSHPVARVTWCHAYAYCAFAHKRLCRGPLPTDSKTGEWYAACSAGGTRLYPYGDAHVPLVCNEMSAGTVAVASLRQCEGGIPGLFDMSGNAQEWVTTCNDDAGKCLTAGGAYSAGAAMTICPWVESLPRAFASEETGIRCCADPQ